MKEKKGTIKGSVRDDGEGQKIIREDRVGSKKGGKTEREKKQSQNLTGRNKRELGVGGEREERGGKRGIG